MKEEAVRDDFFKKGKVNCATTINIVINWAYLANVELFDRAKLGRGLSPRPLCTDTESGSKKPPISTKLRYSCVCNDANDGFLYNLSNNDEHTTDTELAAIAAEAIHGSRTKPNGVKMPAANGIPSKLYMLANRKFKRILFTVFRLKSKQATTSSRSFCIDGK